MNCRWLLITLLFMEWHYGSNRLFGAEPGEVVCHRATGAITIDGKAEEAAWTKAEIVSRFHHPAVTPAELGRTKTKARLLWDDEALYFFAEMEDADLYADVIEQDSQTWENDVFELFFKPDRKQKPYYEFQVTPRNTHFDACIASGIGGGGIRRWKSAHEFRWETKPSLRGTLNHENDTDEGWSVEGKIPWTDFRHTGGKPKAGDIWRFALCRYDYSLNFDTPDLTSTANLTNVDFHQTENYGALRFDGR